MTAPLFQDHFRELAPRYSALRGLDVRAVRWIGPHLAHLDGGPRGIDVVDVGTGPGRYLDALTLELQGRGVEVASVTGVDVSRPMLDALRSSVPNVRPVRALAEALPFPAGSCDVVMSFNAVHHFPSLPVFLAEAGRVLRPAGVLVLYTRTPDQNRATVWGQYFPGFAERETRLYTRDQLRAALVEAEAFRSARLRSAGWWQWATLPELVRQARRRHYSTFRYYSAPQFAAALATFQEHIRARYPCPWTIPVRNNHLIALATKRAA
ncbi:MAG TPA: class I SAM-dependent methyltransferase [Gemmatimonadales bacterium]|nr:class I SAM-dependent methyltransferase [Gemmatimonadales bacterium]